MNESMFDLRVDGDASPATSCGLGELISANAESEDLIEFAQSADVGDEFRIGGGAAPLFIVRRFA